jgi:ferredoxin-NADP reductase
MKIKTSTLVLKDSYMLTPSVKHFVFSCQEEKLKEFTPGQFITMIFELDGKILRRSYSIANRSHSQVIEFSAGYVENGPASEKLFPLKTGDEIQVNGPFGRLLLKEEPVNRYFLVATSTGIVPYRAMLTQLSEKMAQDPNLVVHILEGVREKQDLIFGEEFLEFTAKHKNAHFHACYSREKNQDLNSYESIGYVQEKLMSLEPTVDDIAYLCGNPAMIDECYEKLIENGLEQKKIRREKYISR